MNVVQPYFVLRCVRRIAIAACLLVLSVVTNAATPDLNEKITSAFTRVFGNATTHEFRDIAIDDSAVADVRRRSGWRYAKHVALHIARLKDCVVGYVLIDDVPGKEQPITYALFVNPDLSVKDLEVLYYREAYGGEIQNESWRTQFNGKMFDPSMHVGGTIANISGATISTNAVTYGVRKLLAVLQVLRDRKLLP